MRTVILPSLPPHIIRFYSVERFGEVLSCTHCGTQEIGTDPMKFVLIHSRCELVDELAERYLELAAR